MTGSLLITIAAQQLNRAPRVVARCHEVCNTDKIRKAGVDAIVSPDFTGALRIASAMTPPHVVTFLDETLNSEENLRVEEIVAPARFPETTIGALNLGSRDPIFLAGCDRQSWKSDPADEHVIRAGDALVVTATPEGRRSPEQLVGQG